MIGTAGHVDHGKSALVQALSGIDPDRWAEEKARGLTIDLGFAWCELPSGRAVSIVDVPGHERFIKNMLAGVGGINLALLVIAADEGVMPQTREHLDILDLLDIDRGLVALTKTDLVDEEWLALVEEEIVELLADTALAGSPIAPVSALTGVGVEELRALIDSQIDDLPPIADQDRPRMPIDRAFSISGFGAVVTGTLLDGEISVGDPVVIEPGRIECRVRGLQSHEETLDTAPPGARTAVNLSGVSANDIERGMVLTSPGWLEPTSAIDIRLRAVAGASRTLPHNATRTLHVGADEVQARIRLLEGDLLASGDSTWAQLRLERPIAAARGDHFVLRSAEATVAGGRIVDTRPRRHHRNDQSTLQALQRLLDGSPDDTLLTVLQRMEPVRWSDLLARSELAVEDATAALERQVSGGAVVVLDEAGMSDSAVLISDAGLGALTARAEATVTDYVNSYPLRAGLPREDLRSRINLPQRAFAFLQELMSNSGQLMVRDGSFDLPDRRVALSDEQQALVDALLSRLRDQGVRPDTDAAFDGDLLEYLEAQGLIVRLKGGVNLERQTFDDMVAETRTLLEAQERATLAEVRDRLGTSRKIAQAFLEHLDTTRVTRRVGDARVLWRG
ncbi:MAG: selenocysteine-specific translation elongation factor [Chloroflexi bacterium]|nr:selenocysteine-specific translation elongation factor [Chloroflexota bacterium]MCY3588735.1 selenocysteine-specific translation elongation factor [Chloroflexota bacterium]MCY3686405.1 selenocysteine-specific translation elongation factor [Chloroflexota bacterium]MDE2708129.1 selenocysteine-specific translation elongation factor [Chloroflexota bacterium]